jgi:hypothetical protein
MSSGERETIDFLASMTAKDVRSRLRLEAKDMRAKEWQRRGGFDGALMRALHDSTPGLFQTQPGGSFCDIHHVEPAGA